ncbi:MAG: hypothetical protein M1825_005619 [Sarcosagium campestre]|nr:MAG: hypothetical protein M1825_005619 [Sarcosagium campestre]
MLSVYVRITFAKEDLPKKPWPNSVAGLPLILDTNDSSDSFSPFTKGISGGGSRLEITTVPELWAMPTKETFAAIATALQEDFNLTVKKIRWFGGCWMVTPENASFDAQALPSRFGRSIIRYDTTEEDNFTELALRQKTPNDQISDDTMYANKLRPGVMISSGPFTGPELFTSSGLPVLCPNGSKRITVASRGFSKVGASVYHPDGRGTKIGVVESVLWDSDISLVKLDQDISYSREPFSSEIGLAPSLRIIKNPERLRAFDPVYFDSPFSGSHEGLLVGVEALRIPSDVAVNESDWVMINIMYFGNKNPHVGDGTCGSVIWDDERDAIAVFRFVEKKDGLVYAVSLCDMERLGYTITDIP